MKAPSRILALAFLFIATPFSVQATPMFDTFGELPGTEFGGDGIPNDHVAISTRQGSTAAGAAFTLTLGLTAHQRFFNPPLSNDGAGTFTATTGTSFSPGGLEGALWNFAFFVGVEGTTLEALVADGYAFLLGFDFDPSASVDLGLIVLTSFAAGDVLEGSQNLLFGFLSDGIPGIVFPPQGEFDPNAPGLFSFSLAAIKGADQLVSSIDVRVIPVPATALLFGFGLAGLGFARRRRGA